MSIPPGWYHERLRLLLDTDTNPKPTSNMIVNKTLVKGLLAEWDDLKEPPLSKCLVVADSLAKEIMAPFFPDFYILPAFGSVCGRGFDIILVMIPDFHDDRERMRAFSTWADDTLVCRLNDPKTSKLIFL